MSIRSGNLMTTTFEQPKHLSPVIRRRLTATLRSSMLTCFLIVFAQVVLILLSRMGTQHPVKMWEWLLAPLTGLIPVAGIWMSIRHISGRRYLRIRERDLYLSDIGFIKYPKIVECSFYPDRIEPRYTRLKITCKVFLGRKRWQMLLDDSAQVMALRAAFDARQIHQTSGSD